MAEVIGVKFKDAGKVYYFDPDGHTLEKGARVVVETARGVECGTVANANREVPDEEVTLPLKAVERKATDEDRARLAENREREKEAFRICEEKIEAREL